MNLKWCHLCAYLARVLASLQVSSAEHGIIDHAGVGVVAIPVGQDGDVQALQLVTVSGYDVPIREEKRFRV